MGLPVQLFILLVLVTLPIVFVQLYSADSHAFLSADEPMETSAEVFYESIPLVGTIDLNAELNKDQTLQANEIAMLHNEAMLIDDGSGNTQGVIYRSSDDEPNAAVADSEAIKTPDNHKKVRLVKGKRNAQGMNFLSVLLMLKDRQR